MKREIVKITVTCYEGDDGEIEVDFTPADLEAHFKRVFKESAAEAFLACAQ